MPIINANFNGSNIQNANILLTKIDHDTIPPRELKRYRIIRGDGEIITDNRFGAKRITLIGRIQGTDKLDLETRMDAFRQLLTGFDTISKVLFIDYLSTVRNYTTTCVNLSFDRRNGTVNFAEFQADFISTTPFGYDTTATTLVSSVVSTTEPKDHVMTVGGTAERQKLIITVTVNSFTGTAPNTLTVKNNETNAGISVSRNWTAADVLLIDVANFSCKVNGVEMDYTGTFPDFAPGSRTLRITADFTARNLTTLATQVKRYA